ncbi:uncharacterized protein LOC117643038 [Thrips palmi]|uniref:Uncharacterized protein LOC117643038 n=1 Tax=Thrips palmi TaxID=161013 RepID=A0A6P8YKL6_THRPL|nr:uncharacterized protein LOC117643038 [Thrips palmi]
MVLKPGVPIPSDRFIVNSAGHELTDVYTYYHQRFPEAGVTARPIRTTVATNKFDLSPKTQKYATCALDHSDTQENRRMQKLRTLMETKLMEVFPITEGHDLPDREDMEAEMKQAIQLSYKDDFEVPRDFIKDIEAAWRKKASTSFIKHCAHRMVMEKKDITELELDRNRVFKKTWRLMKSDILTHFKLPTLKANITLLVTSGS